MCSGNVALTDREITESLGFGSFYGTRILLTSSQACRELGETSNSEAVCFCHTAPQVKVSSIYCTLVRQSSWVLMLRLLFTLAGVWEKNWKQWESGGSRYWKGCSKETQQWLISLSLGPTRGQGLSWGRLPSFLIPRSHSLCSTPVFRGT